MADWRGRGANVWDRGRGRGRAQSQPAGFASRGRGDGGWRGQSSDRGGSATGWRGSRGDRGSQRGDRGGRGGRWSARVRGSSGVQSAPIPFSQDGQVHHPSQVIRELENETFDRSLETSIQNLSIVDYAAAPKRPGYGTRGQPVTLWANYFELLPEKAQPFNRYSITYVPEGETPEPNPKKIARLTQLLLEQLPGGVPTVSDFRSTILTTSSLGFTDQQYLIEYFSEKEDGPNNKSPKYRASIKFTGTITFEDLIDYLSSTNINAEKPNFRDEIIQATNIVLGHGMKTNTNIITKRNRYFPVSGSFMETWLLRSGLDAFRGFFMSVRAATGRILLNMQVQHLVAWQARSIAELFALFDAENTEFAERHRTINGLFVHVKHLNNRQKRIVGFATATDAYGTPHPPQGLKLGASAAQVRFYRKTPVPARYVSVADHFKETYSALQQPNLPVVNVGTKKGPVYMPAEMCTIVKHQDYNTLLSPNVSPAFIEKTVRYAPENARTIVSNGVGLLRENSEALLNSFGVKINPSMITINARVLDGIVPRYIGQVESRQKGSWNMKNVEFSKGATLGRWSFLWIRTQKQGGRFRSLDEVTGCVNQFYTMLGRCGVEAPRPDDGMELWLNNPKDPGPEIDQTFGRLTQFSLLLVVLPNTASEIYNAVKIAGDIKFGIHTVNVVADNRKFARALEQDNSQYFANVALKFNLKFGGNNQLLRNADLRFVSEGKTMLVGLDVTHPSPLSSRGAPSVSSITASVDARLGQWPADVAIQTGRAEMIEGLKDMFKSRLQLWQKLNKQLPDEIIVYRDGVGETMYDLVRNVELPQIKEACQEIYPADVSKANKPYITIVICGKRHHTRFFPTNANEADPKTGGTEPGTVVDRSITETRTWDFYLQAHTALKGTPKPAHYVVVHDEIFRRRAAASAPQTSDTRTVGQRAQDDLEQITHAMCYMFGRATKAVSLCPPAYYADLVCTRARQWLSRVFDHATVVSSEEGGGSAVADEVRVHPNLRDTMFYI